MKRKVNLCGTRAGYVAGCRCKACTQRNSAEAWARREVANWPGPVPVDLSGKVIGAELTDNTFIPQNVLLEALRRLSGKIKLEALTIVHENRAKGPN